MSPFTIGLWCGVVICTASSIMAHFGFWPWLLGLPAVMVAAVYVGHRWGGQS